MVNRLKMAEQHAIVVLTQRAWSFRRIARELGVHRDTVAQYVRQAAHRGPPPHSNPAIAIIGATGPPAALLVPELAGQCNRCERYRVVILTKLEQGLAQTLHPSSTGQQRDERIDVERVHQAVAVGVRA